MNEDLIIYNCTLALLKVGTSYWILIYFLNYEN
jgi:hypothetical protein